MKALVDAEQPEKVRRGARNGRTPKKIKVRGKVGKSDKPLPKVNTRRGVRDTSSSRAPCRVCGEPLMFGIHKWTSKLIRYNLDGTPHEHKNG